jgi:hypothetical protein
MRSIRVNLLLMHNIYIMHITMIRPKQGIEAVIGKLGIEPLMNGADQLLAFRGIGNCNFRRNADCGRF